jgi:hypothetical protein
MHTYIHTYIHMPYRTALGPGTQIQCCPLRICAHPHCSTSCRAAHRLLRIKGTMRVCMPAAKNVSACIGSVSTRTITAPTSRWSFFFPTCKTLYLSLFPRLTLAPNTALCSRQTRQYCSKVAFFLLFFHVLVLEHRNATPSTHEDVRVSHTAT